jgi:hypothetical protein
VRPKKEGLLADRRFAMTIEKRTRWTGVRVVAVLAVTAMALGLGVVGSAVSAPEASGVDTPHFEISPTSGPLGTMVTTTWTGCYADGASELKVGWGQFENIDYSGNYFWLNLPAAPNSIEHEVSSWYWANSSQVYFKMACYARFGDDPLQGWTDTGLYEGLYATFTITPASPITPPALTVDAQGGSSVTVDGANFPANEDVTIGIESVRTTLGTVTTSSSGTFSATYTVPCTVGNGPHTVIATIVSTGVEASAPVTVSGCSSGAEEAGASVTAANSATTAASATKAVSSQPNQTG